MKTNIFIHIHVGRGGRHNNPGFRTFCGEKDFQQLISACSDQLFEQNRDEYGRFCKQYYTDCNGNILIDQDDANKSTGSIEFDGEYDSDYIYRVEDLGYADTFRVILSSEFKSYELEQWLRDWLLEGIANSDSEIDSFLAEHAESVRCAGFLSTAELIDAGYLNKKDNE